MHSKAESGAPEIDEDLSLLPMPAAVTRVSGWLALTAGCRVVLPECQLSSEFVARFTSRLRLVGAMPVATDLAGGVPLRLQLAAVGPDPVGQPIDESYELQIRADEVVLSAQHRIGLQYGATTLLQLLRHDAHGARLPLVHITDQPRYAWRGLMVDVARHFMPLEDLERVLRGMAALKLNVLHLHLTDDQGFRLALACAPELARVGSAGEFYTRAQMQRLQRYATELGVRVVPEIDLPGHSAAWLAAQPSHGSYAGSNAPARRREFGIGRQALIPTDAAVQRTVQAVLAEVAEWFGDEYLHIGGDEVHPQAWLGDPRALRSLQAAGHAEQTPAQAQFNHLVTQWLAPLGKTPIGWDEVLAGSCPGAMVVQAWRGSGGFADAAQARGHATLLSAPWYLDLGFAAEVLHQFEPAAAVVEQERWEAALCARPEAALVGAPLSRFFKWARAEASAAESSPARVASGSGIAAGTLLGGEACMWSELVQPELLDQRVFSRLPAVAERLWSPADHDGAQQADLYRRLDHCLQHLELVAGLQLAGWQRILLRRLGLSDLQVQWLKPLVDQLEPVPWYARLVGADNLVARGAGVAGSALRPYNIDTPLAQVVDLLPPESLAARRLLALLDTPVLDTARAAELQQVCDQFLQLERLLPTLAREPRLAVLLPLAEDLLASATVLQAWLQEALQESVPADELGQPSWSEFAAQRLPAPRVVGDMQLPLLLRRAPSQDEPASSRPGVG